MITNGEKLWYAIRTKHKSEKIVRDRLLSKGITAYVPLQEVYRNYKTKKKKLVIIPLLSSYVFVKANKSIYSEIIKTYGVSGFLKIAGEVISIPDSEIETLKMVAGDCEVYEGSQEDFAKGDDVEIIGGILTGKRGKLVDLDKNKHFVIQLETLGFGLIIDVEPKSLRKINI